MMAELLQVWEQDLGGPCDGRGQHLGLSTQTHIENQMEWLCQLERVATILASCTWAGGSQSVIIRWDHLRIHKMQPAESATEPQPLPLGQVHSHVPPGGEWIWATVGHGARGPGQVFLARPREKQQRKSGDDVSFWQMGALPGSPEPWSWAVEFGGDGGKSSQESSPCWKWLEGTRQSAGGRSASRKGL